jgi:hypothetical protein
MQAGGRGTPLRHWQIASSRHEAAEGARFARARNFLRTWERVRHAPSQF